MRFLLTAIIIRIRLFYLHTAAVHADRIQLFVMIVLLLKYCLVTGFIIYSCSILTKTKLTTTQPTDSTDTMAIKVLCCNGLGISFLGIIFLYIRFVRIVEKIEGLPVWVFSSFQQSTANRDFKSLIRTQHRNWTEKHKKLIEGSCGHPIVLVKTKYASVRMSFAALVVSHEVSRWSSIVSKPISGKNMDW